MVFEFHMDATSELKRAHSILARIKDQKVSLNPKLLCSVQLGCLKKSHFPSM